MKNCEILDEGGFTQVSQIPFKQLQQVFSLP